MKHSTENLLGGGPKTWSRSGSQEDGELLSNLFQSSCLDEDDAANISSNNKVNYIIIIAYFITKLSRLFLGVFFLNFFC